MEKNYSPHSNPQPCIYYIQGRCRFGNKCYYSHEGFTDALIIRHAESEFNKAALLYPYNEFVN